MTIEFLAVNRPGKGQEQYGYCAEAEGVVLQHSCGIRVAIIRQYRPLVLNLAATSYQKNGSKTPSLKDGLAKKL
jgi:hypothetical protein